MKNITINEIPTLLNMLGNENDKENLLTAIVDDLKDGIGDLQLLANQFDSNDEECEMLNRCCRVMAGTIRDLKAIHSEVKAARLINEAGLKPRKGGAAQ